MKNRTFILLAANLVLVFYIFLNIQEEELEHISFESHIIESVSELELLKHNLPGERKSYSFKKNALNELHLDTPINWPANPLVISNFLTSISHLDAKFLIFTSELPKRGEILTDYGFDENSTSFDFICNQNTLKLTLGNFTRDENFVYILSQNDQDLQDGIIWKASSSIVNWFSKKLMDWALPNFIHYPLFAIDEIASSRNPHSNPSQTSLIRVKDDWMFTLPFSARANTEKINLLLNQLITADVKSFYPSISSEVLQAPIYELFVKGLGKRQHIKFFEINATDQSDILFVQSDLHDVSFTVSSSLLETLTDWPKKLREKRLFSIEPQKVSRLKLSSEKSTLTLRQDTKDFWIGLEDNGTSSLTFDADRLSIADLFSQLNTIEITDFIVFNPSTTHLSADGFDDPAYRLEIDYVDSTRQNILFSKSNNDSSFLKTFVTEQALVCLVNEHCEQLLKSPSIRFRERSLFPSDFEPDKINFKHLETTENPIILSIESDGETFERLLDFRAENFFASLPDKDGAWIDGNWVPWRYSLKFQQPSEGNQEAFEFFLSDRIGASTWYAGSMEQNIVCTLPIHLIDELESILSSSR